MVWYKKTLKKQKKKEFTRMKTTTRKQKIKNRSIGIGDWKVNKESKLSSSALPCNLVKWPLPVPVTTGRHGERKKEKNKERRHNNVTRSKVVYQKRDIPEVCVCVWLDKYLGTRGLNQHSRCPVVTGLSNDENKRRGCYPVQYSIYIHLYILVDVNDVPTLPLTKLILI